MTSESSHYLNRELSWLEFNQRVLEEAQDSSLPLIERLRFLTITASNLDEFFMVRVGGLQVLSRQGGTGRDPAGLSTDEQLVQISERTHTITQEQYRCYLDDVDKKLAAEGIKRVRPGEVTHRQATHLKRIFESEIFGVYTPMAIEPDTEFPLLINRTLNVAVQLEPADGTNNESAEPRFAIIPLGRSQLRFITLPSEGGYEYMLLEDVIDMFSQRLFPGEGVVETIPFRITRNADLSVQEDDASDLMTEMEQVLDARVVGHCARLELASRASDELLQFLVNGLEVSDLSIYSIDGPLDLSAFTQLTDISGYDSLKYQTWTPRPSLFIDPTVGMFDAIAARDIVLYHPYENFDPVLSLIEEAAADPDVLAIKQTLYRTSDNSPIADALARAARHGKFVTAIVELKARFDEAQNIERARMLEQSGVQVIYGVKGLKTHAKLCIVVRREPHGIQRYVHFGTGNYNEATARIYSDVSFLTCNEELGADAISFFNAVSGYSQPQTFRKLAAAPIGLREKLLELIESETDRKEQGQEASITAKLNSLVDPEVIQALYKASKAGVQIRLNVRGICCLKPGVKGLSENITVVSIIDRFLEHARILLFHHGGDQLLFISSADWMPRNLDRRVELMVPIEDRLCKERLIDILETSFLDNVKSSRLEPNGLYQRLQASANPTRSQEAIYLNVKQTIEEAAHSRPTVFEPYMAPGSEQT
ncbi:MAG: polyphosphate kinase 1 [Planctomycetaceae bacterium]|nr:polyphosphate kinase 1 [Planctomycetaceae bacterium]